MDYLTIDELNPATSAASGDYIPFWRTANGDTRKITKVNFIGANITGGGTIATGGYTLTLTANATISGNADETRLTIASAPAKTTPIDADTTALIDSAASNALKQLSWLNIKATLKTYFDTLYSFAGLATKTTPIDADHFVITDSAASDVGKRVTGTNLKAYLKTYNDTLYGLKGSINTWALAQTFTSGIVLGNEALTVYDENTYLPTLGGSTAGPTTSYSIRQGNYRIINKLCIVQATIVISAYSGGSGFLYLSLPATAAAVYAQTGTLNWFDNSTNTNYTGICRIDSGAAVAYLMIPSGFLTTAHPDLSDMITISVSYFIA